MPDNSPRSAMSPLLRKLARPIDAATLGCFRIVFGLLMLHRVADYWQRMEDVFPAWEFRPQYQLLTFLEAVPAPPPGLMFVLLVLAAAGMAGGALSRTSAAVFCVAYTWVFLRDPTHFNNHDYLITLLAFWLAITRSGAAFSVDAWLKRSSQPVTIPAWHVGILAFHIALVYFFGGINKLNADWLRGEPMRIWLAVEEQTPLIGPLLAKPVMGLIFAWGGMLFDLSMPFLLIFRRTRFAAIIANCLFHLTNSWLFDIEVFPWLMIGANLLFLPPDIPRRWLDRMRRLFTGEVRPSRQEKESGEPAIQPSPMSPLPVTLLAGYVLLHLVIPFRHLLVDGNVEWTENTKNFSWRMMLTQKEPFAGIRIFDPDRQVVFEVVQMGGSVRDLGHEPGRDRGVLVRQGRALLIPRRLLTYRQRRGKGIWGHPELLAQWARYLREEARQLGIERPQVIVEAVAAMNGRPYQFLTDPDVDLSTVEIPLLQTPEWVVPLQSDAPIGDYALSAEERARRINAAILNHRSGNSTPLAVTRR